MAASKWMSLAGATALFLGLTGCPTPPAPDTDSGVTDANTADRTIRLDMTAQDSGRDTSTTSDAAGDSAMPTQCNAGAACVRGTCEGAGYTCDPQRMPGSLGSAEDPVTGYDGGEIPTGSLFTGGHCGPDPASPSTRCTPGDDPRCGTCATCLNLSTALNPYNVCLQRCTPSDATSECREGYTCDLQARVCVPFSCASDDACKVYREDSNHDGRVVNPAAAVLGVTIGLGEACTPSSGDAGVGGPDAGRTLPCVSGATCDSMTRRCVPVDRLVYNAMSTATCNRVTGRCTGGGRAEARPGSTCSGDQDCQSGGQCFEAQDEDTNGNGTIDPSERAGTPSVWNGGYCSKIACDVAGRSCGTGAHCENVGSTARPIYWCLADCLVGSADATLNPEAFGTPRDTNGDGVYDEGGHGEGCRPGYTCDAVSFRMEGLRVGGACLPGEFNDIRVNNVASTCTDSSQCYSPWGTGVCMNTNRWLTRPPEGFCSISGCALPGVPGDICGSNGVCVTPRDTRGTARPESSSCYRTCMTGADCPHGFGCSALAAGSPIRVCQSVCETNDECRAGEACVDTGVTVQTTSGTVSLSACRPSTTPDAGTSSDAGTDASISSSDSGSTAESDAGADAT